MVKQHLVAGLVTALATLLVWSISSTGASGLAHADDSNCTENGPAYCVGAETGPFRYQVSNGNILGFGPDRQSAIANFEANMVATYGGACPGWTVQDNTPPQPTHGLGAGNASQGNYSQALQGIGQYWSIDWNFSTEYQSQEIPRVYQGTYSVRTGCTATFGPWGAYVYRHRDAQCPGGPIYFPYYPNTFSQPRNDHCVRALNTPDPGKNLGNNCGNQAGDSSTTCSAADTGTKGLTAHPVNPSNGNKFLAEADYIGAGPMPLGSPISPR